MSQVDYLHFFNNIIWNFIQLLIMYAFISVVYVQIFYKVLRLRLLSYTNLTINLKKKDYFINKFLNKLKSIKDFIVNKFKSYKIVEYVNKKVII